LDVLSLPVLLQTILSQTLVDIRQEGVLRDVDVDGIPSADVDGTLPLKEQSSCQGDTKFPLASALAQHVLLLIPHILTSPRSLTIGTPVIRVVLTFRTNIRPRLALYIGEEQRMMRVTRVKMHRLTSIRVMIAVLRTCIKQCYLHLGSPDREERRTR